MSGSSGDSCRSRTLPVLWATATACYAAVAVASLLNNEWLAGPSASVGVWRTCAGDVCASALPADLLPPGPPVAASPAAAAAAALAPASLLCALSNVAAFAALLALPLFFFLPPSAVFKTCGWLQILSGALMGGSLGTFAGLWGRPGVRLVCADSAAFRPGNCSPRWGLPLAAAAVLDAVVLAALAFALAANPPPPAPQPHRTPPSAAPSLSKGEVNGAFLNDSQSMAGSRKSLNLHPVLVMCPTNDTMTMQGRPGRGIPFRPDYSSTLHNFQL